LRKIISLSLFLGIALVTTQALAGMYRWTDDQGNVVYSQTPPPDNRPVKPIAPPPPPAAAPQEAREKVQKLQQQLDNIAAERKEKQQEQEQAEQERKARAEKCTAAKKALQTIKERPSSTLWRLPDGSYQRFTVEERETQIGALNKSIQKNCP